MRILRTALPSRPFEALSFFLVFTLPATPPLRAQDLDVKVEESDIRSQGLVDRMKLAPGLYPLPSELIGAQSEASWDDGPLQRFNIKLTDDGSGNVFGQTLGMTTGSSLSSGQTQASQPWYQPSDVVFGPLLGLSVSGTADGQSFNAPGAAGASTNVSLTNNVNVTNYLGTTTAQGPVYTLLKSPGIIAETIGGTNSGTIGGTAGTLTLTNNGNIYTGSAKSAGIIGHSLGGKGGSGKNGGNAGAVTITNNGDITTGGTFVTSGGQSIDTQGADSPGIMARSIGAYGGAGTTVCEGLFFLCFYGYGTDGGNGGNGEEVRVINSGTIKTGSAASQGILAQSIGGGGGNAGSGEGIVGVGGSAGQGGRAWIVGVDNTGDITAALSRGIQAQSISGGGGDGGTASGLVSVGGQAGIGGGTFNVDVSNTGNINSFENAILAQTIAGGGGVGGSTKGIGTIGGSGGSGGTAGSILVANSGNLKVSAAHQSAIHAQSIGGGGGHGGAAISAAPILTLAVGGSGSNGGHSSSVQVSNSGNIETGAQANFAHGIFAHSVGGGGGSGGKSYAASVTVGAPAISVSVGGTGGVGGNGAAVTVGNCLQNSDLGVCDTSSNNFGLATAKSDLGLTGGRITTHGDHSSAILAQSVGGGGGAGGSSVSVSAAGAAPEVPDPAPVTLAIASGGSGGSAGNGDDVTVVSRSSAASFSAARPNSSSADIVTSGNFSAGIQAQSIGGGGGSAGSSISDAGGFSLYSFSSAGGLPPGSFGWRYAGDGGGAGNTSADVTIDSNSTILTSGNHSYGILAQSVGGGGGSGGHNLSGSLALEGSAALSFGSDGGVGAAAGNVTLRSLALSDASGSTANNNLYGIQTTGDHADAILAQSVGGGGGSGGTSVAGSIGGTIGIGASLGSTGGAGATGGTVQLRNELSVSTTGNHSKGLVAQSIGGGGGNAGISISAVASAGKSVSLSGGVSKLQFGAVPGALANNGGSGGTGNDVTIESAADVATSGTFSTGVVAQSIGGGGGHGGFTGAFGVSAEPAISASLGSAGGTGKTGGEVTVLHKLGNILTTGAHSNGILAHSVGGGGGAGGMAISAAASGGFALGYNIGGNGGDGGNGNNVNVTTAASTSSIRATGEMSSAISAQSIGGGGGNGAVSVSLAAGEFAIAYADVPKFKIGNQGGAGGTGGNVGVHTQASLTSNEAPGLLAQSIGGGGGRGGSKVTGDFSFDPKTGVDISLGASGVSGAAGASAGSVTVDGTVTASSNGFIAAGSTRALGGITTSGNHAAGVLAQSVGGGGGTGGWSFAARVKAIESGEALPASAISMGGQGGIGGNSAAVTVSDITTVSTNGVSAPGIFAQSVGGGGGHGGFSLALSASTANSKIGIGALSFSMGGEGGQGATADGVTVNTNANSRVTTSGDLSAGIVAQSIGGGGGHGGSSIAISGGAFSSSAAISIGGAGGAGGNSTGNVTLTNNGAVTTGSAATSNDAPALLAQSLGGGGGNAGFSISTDLSVSSGDASDKPKNDFGISASIGGSGGSGGSASATTVTSSGPLSTNGAHSSGIVAQSIAGGGGNGGFSVSAAGGMAANQLSLSAGGSGGAGGNASTVTVTNAGNISAAGNHAYGISAQSISGGGGNAGFSVAGDVSFGAKDGKSASVSLGGSGGSGGAAGNVNVNSDGSISTSGSHASAISAQSISGGGGFAGFSIAGSLNFSSNFNANLAIGGSGGSGGSVGAVNVQLNEKSGARVGTIKTSGNDSHGIHAQSIAGGGGSGGFAVGKGLKGGGLLSFGIGGSGGTGETSGQVIVSDQSLSIATTGHRSAGILAQSVSGGGGFGSVAGLEGLSFQSVSHYLGLTDAGGSAGAAGAVTVGTSSAISTQGDGAMGVVAQSISGGGGLSIVQGDLQTNSGVTMGLGARQTLNADGQNADAVSVTLTENASVSTRGSQATAVIAQSIGAGGGWASMTAAGGDTVAVTGGASGVARGSGGAVTVDVLGTGKTITTTGAGAHGIVAQSIGGGGGTYTGSYITATVGNNANASGNGSTVSIANSANIAIANTSTIGIAAQSIGGGGGLVTNNLSGVGIQQVGVSIPQSSSSGPKGNGDAVTVINNGTITTASGNGNSIGILAQSTGGSGGFGLTNNVNGSTSGLTGGFGQGSAGNVTVTNRGAINTSGHGIVAGSIAGNNAAPGTLTVSTTASITAGGDGIVVATSGAVPGGSELGQITVNVGDAHGSSPTISGNDSAIYLRSDQLNVINNWGTIQSPGYAVFLEGGGSTRINNFGGTMDGAFYGTSVITNEVGAIFKIQQNIVRNQTTVPEFPTLGTLTNKGTLAPTPGTVTRHIFNGDFTQTSEGTLLIDFDPKIWYEQRESTSPFDEVIVNGNLSLQGNLTINLLNPHYLASNGSLNVDVEQAVISWNDSASLNITNQSLVLKYEGKTNPGNGTPFYYLSYTLDYDPDGLSDVGPNYSKVGQTLNTLATANRLFDEDAPTLYDIIDQTSILGIANIYDELMPSTRVSVTAAHGYTSNQLAASMYHLQNNVGIVESGGSTRDLGAFGLGSDVILLASNENDRDALEGVVGTLPIKSVPRTAVWFAPLRLDVDQMVDHQDTKTRHYGGTIGIDHQVSDDLTIGASFGFGSSSTDMNNLPVNGNHESVTGSVHLARRIGRSYLLGVASISDHDFENRRLQTLAGNSISHRTESGGRSYAGAIEWGRSYTVASTYVHPYARLTAHRLDMDGMAEDTSSRFGVQVKESRSESYVSELGVRLARQFELERGSLSPSVSLAWKHELSDGTTALSTGFNASVNEFYDYEFAHVVDDRASGDVGFTYISPDENKFFSLRLLFENGSDYNARGIEGRVRLKF
ncbi:MAG: autotransporter outer membrane beta-barrel domain-containing protein [Pseudomonadales bacterium]|nr:autotransporter outer membrane beta-barrel domain-containing protein [Pseudomonadales bacterium]